VTDFGARLKKGLVACLGVVVALGFVIHALNAGNHRPEGIASGG